jgi:hypothetical protein
MNMMPNEQLATKTILMRLIGSKFEKGEMANVVAGPTINRRVLIRFVTATRLINGEYGINCKTLNF